MLIIRFISGYHLLCAYIRLKCVYKYIINTFQYWLGSHGVQCRYCFKFVDVGFNARAQASDFQIERGQVAFLCWLQHSNFENMRHQIPHRLNAPSQIDWAIEDQVKNLNSVARPYDEWAFSPLDFIVSWFSTRLIRYTCLLLLILMLWHIQFSCNSHPIQLMHVIIFVSLAA